MNRVIKLRRWCRGMMLPSGSTHKDGFTEWSGLYDKTGREIYEGDLIQLDEKFAHDTGATRTLCMVGFEHGCFMYGRHRLAAPTHMDSHLWIATESKACTVVGNVFLTPSWSSDYREDDVEKCQV